MTNFVLNNTNTEENVYPEEVVRTFQKNQSLNLADLYHIRSFKFEIMWLFRLPPGLLPVLGSLEWYMTPTLDAALLSSSREGADLGQMLHCNLNLRHKSFDLLKRAINHT